MLKIKQLLEKKGSNAVTIAESASVMAAIHTMHQHGVGSVIIPSASGEPIGILTERDIIRLYAEGRIAFDTLLVKDCMTTGLILAKPDDEVTEVLTVMTQRRFRHMPVVQEDQIIGVISIGDLVKAQLEETAEEARALRDYINS
ncbi:MAG: CBS domain-containing protein [Candidatus Competibacteraceae bacterium]|jgi:CBS domain-containing protein|nr:CBS domain-containing protein [Candidatus Competibacteraceae bacterium]